jgi:hypothetical protein
VREEQRHDPRWEEDELESQTAQEVGPIRITTPTDETGHPDDPNSRRKHRDTDSHLAIRQGQAERRRQECERAHWQDKSHGHTARTGRQEDTLTRLLPGCRAVESRFRRPPDAPSTTDPSTTSGRGLAPAVAQTRATRWRAPIGHSLPSAPNPGSPASAAAAAGSHGTSRHLAVPGTANCDPPHFRHSR